MIQKCDCCGNEFESKRWRKYCGVPCARKMLAHQLESHWEKRKADKEANPKPPKRKVCKSCGGTFITKKTQRLYCSEPCIKRGLEMAVERQRVRREETKRAKVKVGEEKTQNDL